MIEIKDANEQLAKHQSLLCAHEYIQQHGEPRGSLFDLANGFVSLKPIGCSDSDYETRPPAHRPRQHQAAPCLGACVEN